MGDVAFDIIHADLTIRCDQVPTDTLHFHESMGESERDPWFAMNTAYPNTRITICPTHADLEKLYEAIGKALGK